jgi:hypothetical protein
MISSHSISRALRTVMLCELGTCLLFDSTSIGSELVNDFGVLDLPLKIEHTFGGAVLLMLTSV